MHEIRNQARNIDWSLWRKAAGLAGIAIKQAFDAGFNMGWQARKRHELRAALTAPYGAKVTHLEPGRLYEDVARDLDAAAISANFNRASEGLTEAFRKFGEAAKFTSIEARNAAWLFEQMRIHPEDYSDDLEGMLTYGWGHPWPDNSLKARRERVKRIREQHDRRKRREAFMRQIAEADLRGTFHNPELRDDVFASGGFIKANPFRTGEMGRTWHHMPKAPPVSPKFDSGEAIRRSRDYMRQPWFPWCKFFGCVLIGTPVILLVALLIASRVYGVN